MKFSNIIGGVSVVLWTLVVIFYVGILARVESFQVVAKALLEVAS